MGQSELYFCKKKGMMQKRQYKVQMTPYSERIFLPEEGAEFRLNPMERTLYRLFLCHPEGMPADDLPLHWQELEMIYAQESCYVDEELREKKLESLCGESKRVFYATVSRIKRGVKKALGATRARPYYITRDIHGVYKTKAECVQCPKNGDIGVKNASKCACCPKTGDISHSDAQQGGQWYIMHGKTCPFRK